jgi:phospholipase/carboxylesterase
MFQGERAPGWYDLFALGADMHGPNAGRMKEDGAGLARSCAVVDALIDAEVQAGIAPEHILVGGFSQGCALSMVHAIKSTRKLAGFALLSGYLPLRTEVLGEHPHSPNKATPFFMAHGRVDDVVPFAAGQAAHRALVDAGYGQVQFHAYDMGHSSHPQELDDLRDFVLRVLPSAFPAS